MNSRIVISNQADVHPQLLERLARYRGAAFQRPIPQRSREAFDAADELVRRSGKDLILDSGCGTGDSTVRLAALHPDCFVLGVDKSRERLRRGEHQHGLLQGENFACVRADLIDFWRLAHAGAWRLKYHFCLYPNPWPKAEHLVRRWHAHPVFSVVPQLGGRLEMRTNWRIYAAEFAISLALHGVRSNTEICDGAQQLTPFERKYAASGHKLYRLTADLDAAAAQENSGGQRRERTNT